jgi:hypothetical protein
MSPSRLKPAIPASERPQTYAFDRAAAGIGIHENFAGFETDAPVLNDASRSAEAS